MRIFFGTFLCAAFLISGTLPSQASPPVWRARPASHVFASGSSAPTGYAPSQLQSAYGFSRVSLDGKGTVIGVVSAYAATESKEDLAAFIRAFRLPTMYGLAAGSSCTVRTGPHPCFEVASQARRSQKGWETETALDTQWAHAMAPGADILLSLAADSSLPSLLKAIDTAVDQGASIVSMSWGGPEFVGQTALESHFKKEGRAFLAASGDNGNGVSWPASSPFVIGIGGSRLQLGPQGGRSQTETAWSGSGGGDSRYYSLPLFQSGISVLKKGRGVPDVSYAADPQNGFSVYHDGWLRVGGTSAGTPQWAAVLAVANQQRGGALSSQQALNALYASSGQMRDIRSGSNGECSLLCTARSGYDRVTGLGSPRVEKLVPYLAAWKQ